MSPATRKLALSLASMVLAAASALAGAGCGRSDEEAFRKDRLNPLRQRADREKGAISATLQTVRLGKRRDAAAVKEQVSKLAETVTAIGELKPPDSASAEMDAYRAANNRLVRGLAAFATRLAGRSRRRLDSASRRAQSAASQSREAEQALVAALDK